MEINTAIILAGGLGTRLRPLTNETPKPLLALKGKPIIQHAIENLRDYGIKNIILSIGYKADIIKNYFGDGSKIGVNISYCIEDTPLGTGGAIKEASKGLTNHFIVLNGDNLANFNYSKIIDSHQRNNAKITLTLSPVEDVTQYGIAKLEGEKLVGFIEKPTVEEAPSNLNNAGAYVIDPQALNILPDGVSSIERDCFEKLAPLGQLYSSHHDGQWFPTDTLEKYSKACKEFDTKINFLQKKVFIADVDETICESCTEISSQMADYINSSIKAGNTWAFISGTHVKELLRMISSKVKEKHHLLGATGTNYTVVNDDVVQEIYKYSFLRDEKNEIFTAFEKLIKNYNLISMTTKEDQLQDRGSQITLSPLGRGAPLELKKSYDPDGEKRKKFVEYLKQFIDEEKYEIKIGGTTSIDVTKKGLDKEWGITEFLKKNNISFDQVVFFGDKIYPGGNDYPASRIVDCISVKNPGETLSKLNKHFSLNSINQPTEIKKSLIDIRPWGKFEQLTHNEVSTVKILEVRPDKKLSLQSHEKREEMWVALTDGVITQIGGVQKILNIGEKVFIPKGAKHRLISESSEVKVLEISFGKFDEEDITRYEDDFGRV